MPIFIVFLVVHGVQVVDFTFNHSSWSVYLPYFEWRQPQNDNTSNIKPWSTSNVTKTKQTI